jgi:hypothetical protein
VDHFFNIEQELVLKNQLLGTVELLENLLGEDLLGAYP